MNMAFTHKLIAVVKKYPVLYDFAHYDYKNIRKRNCVWNEIGLEMNESGDEVKKKWKNLKDCYLKHLKAINPNIIQNTKKNYKNWPWATMMESFKPYFTHSYVDFGTHELENDFENQFDFQSTNQSDSTADSNALDEDSKIDILENAIEIDDKSRLMPLLDNDDTEVSKGAKRMPSDDDESVAGSNPKKKQKKDHSPIELIFLGYAHTIETFLPKRQALTKYKIAQIIMEQEMLHHDEVF